MEHWFLVAMGFVGFASALTIVLLVTIRSVLEMLDLYGYLPRPLNETFVRKEQRIVESALRRLGIAPMIPDLRELTLYRGIDASELATSFPDIAMDLVRRHLRTGTFTIGRDVHLRSAYYIALREALVDQEAATLAGRLLVAFIRQEIESRRTSGENSPIESDLVVGHRDGSPLLAASVASLLHRPCALYGERPYVNDGNAEIEAILEGSSVSNSRSAILVDDSTTDGHMLLAMANALKRRGIQVKHAFVMFYRNAGTAQQVLRANGIILHSILILDEQALNRAADELPVGSVKQLYE